VATEAGNVGVIPAEITLARTIVNRRSLTPPVDVEALVEEYATLTYADIPIAGADGLCLNMKGGKEKARVLIKQTNLARTRFTLAHELGHLMIPWHVGSIIDTIDLSTLPIAEAYTISREYYQIEEEANHFAAEILMPYDWLVSVIAEHPNLADLHHRVVSEAKVSPIAAAIHLSQFLEPGIVWAIESADGIRRQGASFGTQVQRIQHGSYINGPNGVNPYSYATDYYSWDYKNSVMHWWRLPIKVIGSVEDNRTWQEIFEKIINDISPDNASHKKQSVNGVVGSLNGRLAIQAQRTGIIYTIDILEVAIVQRFKDSVHQDFLQHRDFMLYARKKAEGIFNKIPK
jgi:hypothetical protein